MASIVEITTLSSSGSFSGLDPSISSRIWMLNSQGGWALAVSHLAMIYVISLCVYESSLAAQLQLQCIEQCGKRNFKWNEGCTPNCENSSRTSETDFDKLLIICRTLTLLLLLMDIAKYSLIREQTSNFSTFLAQTSIPNVLKQCHANQQFSSTLKQNTLQLFVLWSKPYPLIILASFQTLTGLQTLRKTNHVVFISTKYESIQMIKCSN